MPPDFIGIGAAKSGTSSLYHYLTQHPQIFMSEIKETNYFAYYPNVNEYRRKFDIRDWESYQAVFKEADNRITGEVSPLYLESSVAAKNIHDRLPSAKIIAILRNPVDRAYSDYQLQVRKNRVTGSFTDSLSADSHVIRGGLYYKKLVPYYDYFSDIQVYAFEAFVANPITIMQNIFSFLGVDNKFEIEPTVKNIGGLPKSKIVNRILTNPQLKQLVRPLTTPSVRQILKKIERYNLKKADPLPDDIYQRLTNFYQKDIIKVQNLTGLDLSNWLSSQGSNICSPNILGIEPSELS